MLSKTKRAGKGAPLWCLWVRVNDRPWRLVAGPSADRAALERAFDRLEFPAADSVSVHLIPAGRLPMRGTLYRLADDLAKFINEGGQQ
jgi:hypothetical protein